MKRLIAVVVLTVVHVCFSLGQGSSPATAAALALNSNGSSTITITSPNQYWKITTTTNGYLKVETNSSSSIDVDLALYDVDGTSVIHSDGRRVRTLKSSVFSNQGHTTYESIRGQGLRAHIRS
ncbi:MAG: hypothetical protein FJ215_10920 [Ignavibacteria bacterium]|nr:hypothetical protein [Ignavibacteria bacterium]